MKIKNYIISNNKYLKINNSKSLTTDIYLFNHIKKSDNIIFKKSKIRKNYDDYKKNYKLIKNKSLNYSRNIRIFLNKYHNYKYSNIFWDKLLNETLFRLTLCFYDFYQEFISLKKEEYLSNIISDEDFSPPELFSDFFKNLENKSEYRDQLLKIYLLNFEKKKNKQDYKKKT